MKQGLASCKAEVTTDIQLETFLILTTFNTTQVKIE